MDDSKPHRKLNYMTDQLNLKQTFPSGQLSAHWLLIANRIIEQQVMEGTGLGICSH